MFASQSSPARPCRHALVFSPSPPEFTYPHCLLEDTGRRKKYNSLRVWLVTFTGGASSPDNEGDGEIEEGRHRLGRAVNSAAAKDRFQRSSDRFLPPNF